MYREALTVEAAERASEQDESAEELESDLSGEARALTLNRRQLLLWRHVRRARHAVVLMGLSCLIALTREPWTLTLLCGLFGVAYWVSRRAPLAGLLIAFASALPGWTYTLVAALLDLVHSYSPLSVPEDEPPAAGDVSLWQFAFMVAFATLLWRGLAAAARLTGEVERSWQRLRPALLLSIVLAIFSTIALTSESLSVASAFVLECLLVAAAAPLVWRARVEWGPLGDWRRLAPRHALETAALLIALVAFMQGYLYVAARFGIEPMNSVVSYQLAGWPVDATLLLLAGWAPLVEEVLFRGFVQSRLERVTTPGSALIAQAMLFSAVHAVPGSLVSHAVIGLALGFLRNRTRTLYAPFVLHAGYNAWIGASDLGYVPELWSFG